MTYYLGKRVVEIALMEGERLREISQILGSNYTPLRIAKEKSYVRVGSNVIVIIKDGKKILEKDLDGKFNDFGDDGEYIHVLVGDYKIVTLGENGGEVSRINLGEKVNMITTDGKFLYAHGNSEMVTVIKDGKIVFKKHVDEYVGEIKNELYNKKSQKGSR